MLELLLVWLAITVSFLLGVAYNSRAYDRGHEDGWYEGFALGTETSLGSGRVRASRRGAQQRDSSP
ncbi:MAG TPA: hypothetical protein VI814_10885 [Candidatus Limnocylindria bacterium]